MRHLLVLTGLVAMMLAATVEATSFNKCIDAQGKVTYSNLPCRNAQEARTLEIDPAPPPVPVRTQPVQAQPAKPKPAAGTDEPASLRLETRRTAGKSAEHASATQCNAIAERLGNVLDKMDQARRKGYTQKQVNAWNEEIRALERKKQQSGCF